MFSPKHTFHVSLRFSKTLCASKNPATTTKTTPFRKTVLDDWRLPGDRPPIRRRRCRRRRSRTPRRRRPIRTRLQHRVSASSATETALQTALQCQVSDKSIPDTFPHRSCPRRHQCRPSKHDPGRLEMARLRYCQRKRLARRSRCHPVHVQVSTCLSPGITLAQM